MGPLLPGYVKRPCYGIPRFVRKVLGYGVGFAWLLLVFIGIIVSTVFVSCIGVSMSINMLVATYMLPCGVLTSRLFWVVAALGSLCLSGVSLIHWCFVADNDAGVTKTVATKRFTPGATVLPPPLISGGGNGGGPPKRKKKDCNGMVGANMFCLCSACRENVFMCVSSFVRSACCHIVLR